MQAENTDFQSVIALLVEGNVEFVLIGGLAMIWHGASNDSSDIAISYDRSPQNLISLVRVLKSCHSRLRNIPNDLPFILDERTCKNALNLMLATDLGEIDLLAEPAGVDSCKGLLERSNEMIVFGKPVRVASLEDLIAMKRAAGRPKDKLHLLELLDLQQFLHDEAKLDSRESA